MTWVKVLPPITQPFDEPIKRIHTPKSSSDYHSYRACLRWEFGFTCAFCLLHEADLAKGGAEGTGIFQIEHFIPVSHDSSLTYQYHNCFYICRYCNRDRSALPNHSSDGRVLLNPCQVRWSDHFHVENDQLKPKNDNHNAKYTADCYGFAHPKKIKLRKMRRELMGRFVKTQRLFARAEAALDQGQLAVTELHRQLYLTLMDLRKDVLQEYQACPTDAGSSCRCREPSILNLPKSLEKQALAMNDAT